MGIKAHVQTKHPAYGKSEMSMWHQGAIWEYLVEREGVNIDSKTGDCFDDHWFIDASDAAKIEGVIRNLRENPDAFLVYVDGEDGTNRHVAESLAELLREGMEAARANGYDTIDVDWF